MSDINLNVNDGENVALGVGGSPNAPLAMNTAIVVHGSGTDDYEELVNLPSINSVELIGNKTAADLGLANASDIVQEVFWATYGTTTPSEIAAALEAGKLVACKYGSSGAIRDTVYPYVFTRVAGGYPIYVFLAVGTNKTVSAYLQCQKTGANTFTWSNGTNVIASTLPSGGSAGQVLKKTSSSDYDTEWANESGGGSSVPVIPCGALDNTSTATVMTATVTGITELTDGVCVWLTNGVVTSASGVTLNINNLGAKPIYSSQAAATAITTQFGSVYTALFIYNSTRVAGGCWDFVYGYDTNTTYTPVKLGFGYATCSTAEATVAKTASLSSYTLTTNGIVSIKFTNAVPANATLNVNSKGAKAIYYKGAAITAGVIKAGDTATFIYSTYYHLISIDRAAEVPSAYTSTPSALGTASAGSSDAYSRGDHVHAMPSASDVGAIAAPASPSSGQFLVYNGSAWVAQSLSTWQGGSY